MDFDQQVANKELSLSQVQEAKPEDLLAAAQVASPSIRATFE